MNRHLQDTIARILLAAYMLAGVLLEVAHHDVHDIVLDPVSAVSNHDCGTNEIHIPLDKRHECLACSQSTLRVATAATYLSANITTFLYLCHVSLKNESTLHTDVISSGKRGPPVS